MKCFASRTKDNALIKESTSGGIFTELARYVFVRSGVVFGAVFSRSTFDVVFVRAETEDELADMRGAKYCPSDMSSVYGQIATCLNEERLVMFVGLPCQTAALRKRFGCDQRLILCGLFCHSVPEKWIWAKYVDELQRDHDSRLIDVKFRDKRFGWKKSSFIARFENGDQIVENIGENVYARAFFEGYSSRASCLACQFKQERSNADILIGDFWGIENVCPQLDDEKGVNAVAVLSAHGQTLLDGLSVEKIEVSAADVVKRNPYFVNSVSPDLYRRKRFLFAYKHSKSLSQSLEYANHLPISLRLYRRVRSIVKNRMGI